MRECSHSPDLLHLDRPLGANAAMSDLSTHPDFQRLLHEVESLRGEVAAKLTELHDLLLLPVAEHVPQRNLQPFQQSA